MAAPLSRLLSSVRDTLRRKHHSLRTEASCLSCIRRSSSLTPVIPGDRGGPQPPACGSSPFSRITRPNQWPLSFIVRACVSKSTYTNPKRIP